MKKENRQDHLMMHAMNTLTLVVGSREAFISSVCLSGGTLKVVSSHARNTASEVVGSHVYSCASPLRTTVIVSSVLSILATFFFLYLATSLDTSVQKQKWRL
jgi:hypothetical protein